MPRIRSVHPEICEDETLPEVSAYAERTFVRLWTHLDDEGRARDDARLLVARLYPLHREMTAERLEKDLCELAEAGLLQRYVVDGKRYLRTKPASWSRWQKPRRRVESKHPPPNPPDNVRTHSDNDRTRAAGEVGGVGGEKETEMGPSGHKREYRGVDQSPNPQVVDIKGPLAERALRMAQGGAS